MIAGFLETISELDTERTNLEAEMAALRVAYQAELDEGQDPQLTGNLIAEKAAEIAKNWNRVTSYYEHSIPMQLRG